ncbi:hypothetical protein B5X24_HaOG204154 [Helicoverpa armigera]|uniref:Reverse transcriptase domain-containing protein n=1 Tax=Helicoverpa armigera TaxID=29058 RepID=A0A2W1BVU2_HELAM|nr:hypothetical protein B5X24_HaOG204154 [Helicoverpa armigera]
MLKLQATGLVRIVSNVYLLGDALASVVFNLVLEAATRKLGINGLIDYNTSQLAAYADDIVISSRSRNKMIEHCLKLEREAAAYGLHVNSCKTEYMASSRQYQRPQNISVGNKVINGVDSFKYLGSMLNSQNKTEEEIKGRLVAGNKCFYSCAKLLAHKLLSIRSKLTIYRTIIRPVETIIRFCKSQRLRWAGHLERMPDTRATKIMTRWTPQQKRPRGRPKKRWSDCIEEDLRKMGKFTNWKRTAKLRDNWRMIVEEAKTHKGL